MKSDSTTQPMPSSDDELAQLSAYVSGTMSEAEVEAFDVRMADDDDFFDRMAPLLKVWYAPPPSVIEAGEAAKARHAARRNGAFVRRVLPWRVGTQRARRILAGGGLAFAAEVLAIAQISHAASEAALKVAQAASGWHHVVPAKRAPLTVPPTVRVVHPRAPRHEAPVIVASATVDSMPRTITVDSATARLVAALDSTQVVGEFVLPTRVADTVKAIGATPVSVPSQIDSTTNTVVMVAHGAGAGSPGAKAIGAVVGGIKGVAAVIIKILGGGKKP